jgi:hypothetical protein
MEFNANPRNLDHMSHPGAAELARRLRKYWLDRGFNIRTRIEVIEHGTKDAAFFCVRSDLNGRGFPPAGSKVLAVEEAA